MTHTTTALRTALLTALTLLAASPAPAHALPGRHAPGNHLYLTVTRGTGADAAGGTLLLCDPSRGHARADRACAELDAAGGDLDRLPGRDTYCPMVHAPVTARARGLWEGHRVAYTRTFPNRCVLGARTGAVFAFSEDGPSGPGGPNGSDRPGPDARPLPGRR
ncbi:MULTISPECIES: SSI family serine proteinase inhibitor [Streptomyces]|uniref:SSI family serine proteinase inhibitor n=1 Tax=Streptomyces TaxID=1883 RepID=UPI0029BFF433|nr:SSI family serine proteinase inhibitor [Streptomyces sp. ME02-6978.2a]